MIRRNFLTSLFALRILSSGRLVAKDMPIQLHVDLQVAPLREEEMVKNYRNVFQPAISRQPGFVHVELLRLRDAVAGTAPANSRFRLIISFETEGLRKQWVATDDHQQAWPTIEKTLTGAKYTALLYDPV